VLVGFVLQSLQGGPKTPNPKNLSSKGQLFLSWEYTVALSWESREILRETTSLRDRRPQYKEFVFKGTEDPNPKNLSSKGQKTPIQRICLQGTEDPNTKSKKSKNIIVFVGEPKSLVWTRRSDPNSISIW
jgi:hypothetical protein